MPECSGNDLAQFLNMTKRRIQILAVDKIMVKTGRDKYDFLLSIKGYIAYQRVLLKADEKKLTAENLKIKTIKRREADGKLVNVDEYNAIHHAHISATKKRILAAPIKCAQEVEHAKMGKKSKRERTAAIQKILKKELDEIVKDLFNWKPR